jgi:hypothetical protein
MVVTGGIQLASVTGVLWLTLALIFVAYAIGMFFRLYQGNFVTIRLLINCEFGSFVDYGCV